MTFAQGTFYVLAAVTIISALGVVVVRNVVYSALLLILTLSLTGLVYLYLYADFLALVQILIYGGTVSVLLLFALMLTRPEQYRVRAHTQWPLAIVAAIVVFVVLAYQALATDWLGGRTPVLERAGPDVLGEQLFGPWAVPFEIASVVLLVALLGALIMARRTEGES